MKPKNSTIPECDTAVGISTINGAAPTPNMSITAANLTIVGIAHGEVTITRSDENTGKTGPPKKSDITNEFRVVIRFGRTSMIHWITTSDNGKHWSLTLPVPLGSANAGGLLLITVIACP